MAHKSFTDFFTDFRKDGWAIIMLKIVMLIQMVWLVVGGVLLLTLYRIDKDPVVLADVEQAFFSLLFVQVVTSLAAMIMMLHNYEHGHNVSWTLLVPLVAGLCFDIRAVIDAYRFPYAGVDNELLCLRAYSFFAVAFGTSALVVYIIVKLAGTGVTVRSGGGGRVLLRKDDEAAADGEEADLKSQIMSPVSYTFVPAASSRPKIAHQPAQKFE